MWTVFFFITTVICGIGWLGRYISVLAIIYYIEKKGYTHPNDVEIKECTLWVVRKLFKR